MKEVYDVCRKNEIGLPTEVFNFFYGQMPDGRGQAVGVNDLPNNCVEVYEEDRKEIIEITISRLPDDAKIIKIVKGPPRKLVKKYADIPE